MEAYNWGIITMIVLASKISILCVSEALSRQLKSDLAEYMELVNIHSLHLPILLFDSLGGRSPRGSGS